MKHNLKKTTAWAITFIMLLTSLPAIPRAVHAEEQYGTETSDSIIVADDDMYGSAYAETLYSSDAAVTETTSPAITDNTGKHEYTSDQHAAPVYSYLVANADTTLTRVEYTGSAVAVETYSSDLKFLDGSLLAMELPFFGGFYAGENYNFLVFGKESLFANSNTEVIRVVRYSKDWKRIDAVSLTDTEINTQTPFQGGSLRFAEYNGYLYIHTSHLRYQTGQQANITMNIKIDDEANNGSMAIKTFIYGNMEYGIVNNAHNQFIAVDGKNTSHCRSWI